MTAGAHVAGSERVHEIADEYEDRGYRVTVQPDPSSLPFDLGGYRPDLLAEKDGQHYLIAVRASGTRLSVDRFVEVAREVSRHPGWRFLLVTADDVTQDGLPLTREKLLSWDELRAQASAAAELSKAGQEPAAILALWAALEGILRRYAERVSLPVERLPASVLIKHLYSHGELSMQQYDAARAALEVRSRVAHGFEASGLSAAVSQLSALVRDLLREWNPDRRVA